MAGLTVQSFASGASGMAVLWALARGLVCPGASEIGNFWVDLVRSRRRHNAVRTFESRSLASLTASTTFLLLKAAT